MKKVALFLANGFEEIEALATVDILRRALIQVETVSISDEVNVTGAHGVTVVADNIFSETDFSDIDVLVLPGGMPGAKHLNEHNELKTLIGKFNDAGKLIAAICAAPIVLGGLGMLQNKRATCYPGFESELTGAQITGEKVEVDDNIITGRGPGLTFDFALNLVEQIVGKEIRKEVEAGLLL